MVEQSRTIEISKLKRLIVFMSLVMIVLGGLLILLFVKKDRNPPVTNELYYSELITQLKSEFVRELDAIRSELEATRNMFELAINNQQETINLLKEPNILAPFHTYTGQAGIVYRNIEGKGRWVPNHYGYELSQLIDQAIRRAKSVIVYPEEYILINYHLDELGPSIHVIIDLVHSKVLINDKEYEIAGEDLERIINFLEANSIDGNHR